MLNLIPKLILALVIWRVFWRLAYHLLGFYIGYVTINNGILFYNLKFRRSYTITASSVRIRLWGNTRKVIISDLKVVLPSEKHKTTTLPYPNQPNSVPTIEKLHIFPRSRLGKKLARFVIAVAPDFSIEFRSSEIQKGKIEAHIESLQLNVSVRQKHTKSSDYMWNLSATILQSSVIIDKDVTQKPTVTGESLRLLMSCSLNSETGLLSDGCCRFSIVESALSVFDVLKLLKPRMATKTPPQNEQLKEPPDIKQLALIHNVILNTFDEVSFSVVNLLLTDLPLLPTSQNCSLEDYFSEEKPRNSFIIAIKSLAIHLMRVKNTDAGFDVLFNSTDRFPFELTLSSLILEFSFAGCYSNKKNPKKIEQFLTLPNFSCSFKTNIPGHLIEGSGLQDGVLELFCSCSSPIVDFDVEQLALVAFNYMSIKKVLRLHELSKQRGTTDQDFYDSPEASASEDDDTTRTEDLDDQIENAYKGSAGVVGRTDSFLTRAYYLLDECYPRINVKLTIEQPRIILSCLNIKEDHLQFLVYTFSMMVLQVLTINRKEYDLKCHVLHPCASFNQKSNKEMLENDLTQEFSCLSEVKINCRVMQNLKVKPAIEIHGAYLNLTRPRVLNGISHILNQTANLLAFYSKNAQISKQLDGELVKERDHSHRYQTGQNVKPLNIDSIFCYLPSWLVSIYLKLEDINVLLGSTSPFLNSADLENFLFSNGDATAETLNKSQISISSISAKLENSECEDPDYASSFTSFSLDTLTAEQEYPALWKSSISIDKLKVAVFDELRLKSSLVLEVPSLDMLFKAVVMDKKPLLLVECNTEELNLSLDKFRSYALFGLVHLIKHTIIKPSRRLKRKFMRSSRVLKTQSRLREKTQFLCSIKSTVQVQKVNIVLGLFKNFKVRLQAFNINSNQHGTELSVQSLFVRGLISSSTQSGYWDRILCVDSPTCRLNGSGDNDRYVIETLAIRLIQPNKFVVFELFDSLSVFVKIIKHLVKAIRETDQTIMVYPSESEPLKVPTIKLKANKIMFSMEDDPFETELGMIYQLGLVEQRKRLDLIDLHEDASKEIPGLDSAYQERLIALYKSMEVLWIRKVKAYKARVLQEIEKNSDYLYGSESAIPKEDSIRVRPYQRCAPLCHIVLSEADLSLSAPRFVQKDISQFIYDNGQGVPKKTRYSLMLPTFLKLAVEELRIHLRDYPLPLLYLPQMVDSTGKGRALMMQGNLIIAEAISNDERSLRKIIVPLTESNKTSRYPTDEFGKFDRLVVLKSLAPVKLYTDMDILFDSEQPSRFVWGQSYQFGIQQIMLKFDQFSKPPIDPSPAIGFWDKLRLIMHGHISIKTGKRASLEVAFKGGRDPYNVFGDSTGFILRLKDSVEWKVNENDDSLDFFQLSAQKVSWYIPNYLATPLVCWCRDSSEYTLMYSSKEIVTSCFGYYLKNSDLKLDSDSRKDVCEKNVVVLSGGVNLKVGFLLQRPNENKKITNESIPHYEINLYDPNATERGHDSYNGFRTSRMHMAISLVANTNDSYNTIHLSPMTFRHFFAWWKLFAGNTMLPIRRGKLFGEEKDKPKFSASLYTNKFLFHLKNLFIGHVYRSEDFALSNTKDEFECVGLRAKVDDFLVDLHQRKTQVVDVNEDLSRHKKVMKMLFNLGEVVLTRIDLRTLNSVFIREVYSSGKHPKRPNTKHKIFDDKRWYDTRDYLEAFEPSSGMLLKSVAIEPLMYSDKFSYIRDANDGVSLCDWGQENTHNCMLHATDIFTTQIQAYTSRIEELKHIHAKNGGRGTEKLKTSIDCLNKLINECRQQRKKSVHRNSISSMETMKEKFHNRFVVILMFLKWNEDVRNQFMKYLHFVQLSSRYKKYLPYRCIRMFEDMLNGNDFSGDSFSLASGPLEDTGENPMKLNKLGKFGSAKERIENFNSIVREVGRKEKITEDYRIEIISPQIQLHTKEVDDSVVIITAPTLESKILSVLSEKESNSADQVLETRYGCILHDASVLVFEKNKNSDLLNFEEKPYGTTSSWPPFLGIETCKSLHKNLKEQTLIDQMSLMITYDEVFSEGQSTELTENCSTYSTESDDNSDCLHTSGNRLRIDVPELIIRSTSKQYFTLYITVLSLLIYMEPLTAELRETVRKLKLSIDFEDYEAHYKRLRGLHSYLGITKTLLTNYSFRHDGQMDNEELNDFIHLAGQKSALTMELLLTVQTLLSGHNLGTTSTKDVENWRIAADKITLHMLKDNRDSILDLFIENGRYKRFIKDNGFNDNSIEIANIWGSSRLPNSYYKDFLQLLSPHKDDLITVTWSMGRPIGGIKMMDNFEIASKPLKVQMDEEIGTQLMRFIFYTDNGELDESPILHIADQSDLQSLGEDDFANIDDTETNSHTSESFTENQLKFHASSSKVRRNKGNKSLSVNSPLNKSGEFNEEVETMLTRSKKYISIKRFVSRSFEILISLRMKSGVKRLLNVTDFLLTLKEWEIERQVISLLNIADMFKKLVIKTLVQHSGRLLRNKANTMRANHALLRKQLFLSPSHGTQNQKLIAVEGDDVSATLSLASK